MKKSFFLSFLASISIFFACKKVEKITPEYDKGINVIPAPLELIEQEGYYSLVDNTKIMISSEDARNVAEYFAGIMRASTGYKLPVELAESSTGNINLSIDKELDLEDEAYKVDVNAQKVTIVAKTEAGLFYGVQTLLQLLPAEIQSKSLIDNIAWHIPSVQVNDKPRFGYRGMLIDVSRHFLTIEQLKKHIDVISMFKVNRLHLHLTDDQGWRIEIKKYPKLTEIASKRIEDDGTEYGGYYTQDELKELVKYASDRFITIVPEIDMPGHTMSVLTAYPELASIPNPLGYKVRTIWGVERDILNPTLEETYQFVDDVLAEVVEIFPSEYIHIGGDEAPKDNWKKSASIQAFMRKEKIKNEDELQSYFIQRVEKIAEKHGRKIIGWDEILEGGLAENATVMSWRGEKGGIEASNMGHDVIMTPGDNGLYIDHYQGDPMVEPLGICCYEPMSTIYSYDPVPKYIVEDKRHHIIGVQANLWAEYLYTPEMYDYRAYPRMLALSEVAWSDLSRKDYEDFCRRLNNAYVRLDAHNINYHIPIPEQIGGSCDRIAFVDSSLLTLQTSRPMDIVYSFDEEPLNEFSNRYQAPIVITEDKVVNTASVLPSGKLSPIRKIKFTKSTYAPATQVEGLKAGLSIKTSKGDYNSTADFANATNWKESTIKNVKELIPFWLPNDIREIERSAVVAEGFIKIEKDGIYEFGTEYEELWIDNNLIIDNNGKAPKFSRQNTTLALAKGLHPIKIVWVGLIRGGFPSYWSEGKVFFREWGADNKGEVTPEMIFHK